MTFQAPRGMRDVLPEQMPAWERLEATARRLALLGGYREIRPPLLEDTQLFIRSVGEVTDIVEKEMFTLHKGEHSLSLRPEGTAGIARAYVQAGYPKRSPVQKLFTIGPMFRYERPQKGRERQFTQFDVEAIGSLDPRLDAEVIDMAAGFFEALGIPAGEIEVRINSMGEGEDRERYKDALRRFLGPAMAQRCGLCNARFERNVLRVLDCKNPECARLNAGAPRILDFLSAPNRAHFEAVQRHLGRGIARAGVVVDSGIVRGLDYYTRTVFEVHHPPLGARSALCGGGRYDHLVRDVGGPDLGAVGFAIGFSSTLLVLEQLGLCDALAARAADVYVAATDASLADEVLALAAELRRGGLSAVYDSEDKSLKAQMRAAGAGGHPLVAILGPDELRAESVQLKHMHSGEQSQVARADLIARARASLARQP